MPADALLLDVIPHFQSAKEAITFIAAADLPLKRIPRWPGEAALKLQGNGGISLAASVLQEKNYYAIRTVFSFGEEHSMRSGEKLARRWLLKCVDRPASIFDPGLADHLVDLMSVYYFNPDKPLGLTCYMDGNVCFVNGRYGWEEMHFGKVLDIISTHMGHVLEDARSRLLIDTIGQLADEPGQSSTHQIMFGTSIWTLQLMARVPHDFGQHAATVKKLLRRNKTWLEAHGAFA